MCSVLRVMRVPARQGAHTLGEQDSKQSIKVALVNEELARRHLAGEDPSGKRLILYHTYASSESSPYEVVGVISEPPSSRAERIDLPATKNTFLSSDMSMLSRSLLTAEARIKRESAEGNQRRHQRAECQCDGQASLDRHLGDGEQVEHE